MLYIETRVLLALLTPEANSAEATAFPAKASAPLAINAWSVTGLHSAIGLTVRTNALSQEQAETVLQSFVRSLTPGLLMLKLAPQPPVLCEVVIQQLQDLANSRWLPFR
jgi:hypothetical protein